MEIKVKINKRDLIKQKILHNEGNYMQGEKTDFRMEKIIANKATDKELISKIYKLILQLNFRKISNTI